MSNLRRNQYRPIEEYKDTAEAFIQITSWLLFSFGENLADKDRILQNFMSRTIMSIRGIFSLWELKDFQDCWVLHRCLIDRYFHLVALGKDDAYEEFEKWSFMKQFEALNRVRSDPNNQGIINSPDFTPLPEQRARYANLQKSPPRWKRPKAEDVAKLVNLPFLYTYSYDFASTHIHPMANDGLEDFFNITGLEPRPEFPSQITVIHNSILVGIVIVRECMNQSSLAWMKIAFDFYDHLMKSIEDGTDDYKLTAIKMGNAGPGMKFAAPNRQ